jgi:hypothetical protein
MDSQSTSRPARYKWPVRSLLIVAAFAAGAALAVAPRGDAFVACGRISFTPFGTTRQVAYSVRIVKGNVSCRTARRVMLRFMEKNTFPRGWFCARGHASQGQKWAASCGTAAGANVKAYGPLRR